jgi:hypothetical protein
VLVTPRQGVGFILQPVNAATVRELPRWLQESAWIEKGPDADAWAQARWTALQSRKDRSLRAWEAGSDKPTLRASDGR